MSRYKVPIASQSKSVGLVLVRECDKLVAVRRALPNHMLKKPPAWAFSEEVIDFMQKRGVDVLCILCEGVAYSCDMAKFLKLAVPFNRGFGAQRHLPLQYWDVSNVPIHTYEATPAFARAFGE